MTILLDLLMRDTKFHIDFQYAESNPAIRSCANILETVANLSYIQRTFYSIVVAHFEFRQIRILADRQKLMPQMHASNVRKQV